MRFQLDPTSPSGISIVPEPIVKETVIKQSAGFAVPGPAGRVQSIVAGSNIAVNSSDPANPVVSTTGGGTVTSVTAGDTTITIGGTAVAPTVAVNVIPESKVTNLVSDLAGKQPTGNYITGLGGDLTATGPGNVTGTLTSIVTAGTVGDATHIPVITYDAKGRIIGTTTATISSGTQRTFVTAMGF